MTEEQVDRWITKLIEQDKVHEFYVSKEWRRLRKEVLADNHNECEMCKARGMYTKANHVHHVQYVRKHPRYALSKTYTFQGKEYKNLMALCHNCHEEIHGYRQKHREVLTVERW